MERRKYHSILSFNSIYPSNPISNSLCILSALERHWKMCIFSTLGNINKLYLPCCVTFNFESDIRKFGHLRWLPKRDGISDQLSDQFHVNNAMNKMTTADKVRRYIPRENIVS